MTVVTSALDVDGFVVLDGLLDADTVTGLRAAVAAELERNRDAGPTGTAHADDLTGPAVDALLAAPALREGVGHLLGEGWHTVKVGLRAPNPGYGGQELHADFAGLPPAQGALVAVAIVALVEVTERGGATRVLPGTHRWRKEAPVGWARRTHPDERRIPLRAGSALLLNGHLWHSGTRNDGDHRRDVLQVSFARRGVTRFGT